MSQISIHNTLTRTKEPFTPSQDNTVRMYVCGPTVYDDSHIGHLMGPVLFDTIARWFHCRGYDVRFANNITDIDDKIINRSIETGEDWHSITKRFTQKYFDYLNLLHVNTITDFPRCSDYMSSIIGYISDLVADNKAYEAADGVYYNVRDHKNYGKLSGRKIEDMLSGARIERDESLQHPADFCLWKLAKAGEPSWESPWGAGRPGWHIECTVMATELLGSHFDIHGGGDDLKFPHHENEIAQAEGHGDCYASCWMHNGLIQYEGVKISKSDPRNKDPEFAKQFKAAYLLEEWSAPVIRFFLLQGHYRRPFDFAPKNIAAAQTALGKLHKVIGDAIADDLSQTDVLSRDLPEDLAKLRDAFATAMDDDFNAGAAIGHLFAMAKLVKQHGEIASVCLRDLGRCLGLFQPSDVVSAETSANDETLNAVMNLVLSLRQDARANRDFATADRIRDDLTAAGITVKDGPDGAVWEYI